MTTPEHRAMVRRMLDESSPADAPTAYYALHHTLARTNLLTWHADYTGDLLGFVAVCQTGIDLFRPLVTLQCVDAETAAAMLPTALTPERPYIFFAKLSQLAFVGDLFRFDQHRTLQIYRLDPRRFQPEINILVQHKTAPDGSPRAVIESGDETQAVAGVNWQSPHFAELYVQVSEDGRRRGWGASVVSAVTQAVLDTGRTPLYLVEMDNEPSRALAEKLGYTDTAARQVVADVVYTGS